MTIEKFLEKAATLKICIVGDLIVDHYVYGDVTRISPEAPVPVVHKKNTKTTLGGAANVLQNIINLGAHAELFCNYDGHIFWDQSLTDKIHCNPYPAAKKTRVMCGNHQLLRIDDELVEKEIIFYQYRQMSWWEELMNRVNEFDVFVMVDYGKGTLSDSTIGTIIDFARIANKPVIVDAKKNFHRYATVDVMKCNDREAPMNVYSEVGRNRFNQWVVTNGERGMSVFFRDGAQSFVEGVKVPVFDPCGAGDVVTSILALGYSMREEFMNFIELLYLANFAAAQVCRFPGVYAIQKSDIQHLIQPIYEDDDNQKGN